MRRSAGRPRQEAQPDAFAALADLTRRQLLERLAERECSVSELTAGLEISQAAVSQHLKLLRDSGLVQVRAEGRHRYYRMRREGLTELLDWLLELDRFRQARVAALGTFLDENAPATARDGPAGTAPPSTAPAGTASAVKSPAGDVTATRHNGGSS